MNNPYEAKMRIIQEMVPGRQITLAHIIANPDPAVYSTIVQVVEGKPAVSAIGIVNVTPAEITIIAADLAAKAANVTIESADCSTGTLFFAGRVSEVDAAMNSIVVYLKDKMTFEVCPITRT